jgi:hypothetical protein
LDTLNYEQVDFQGQKRIDGFVRYDGKLGSYIDDYYITSIVGTTVGDVFSDADDNVIGIVVGQRSGGAILAVIDYNRLPTGTWGVDTDEVNIHYDRLLAFNNILRERTEGLPGPIAGLHWFRDRLYAIATLTSIAIEFSGGPVFPNDVLTIGSSSALVVKVVDNVVTLSTTDPSTWLLLEQTIKRGGVTIGTTAGAQNSDVASFFESRTEIQSETEDDTPLNAGWKLIHQGWVVPFENGISLYGSLPSLNQNIQGLGVQGPTSVAGTNGRPLTLTQGINISGEQAQVSGWKSSETPTSYGLNPADVWDIDARNTYADAFISWNGTTGQVSAPGVTTNGLTQYSPTNTVEVEVA